MAKRYPGRESARKAGCAAPAQVSNTIIGVGPQGPPGNTNVFIQQAQPPTPPDTKPFFWIELNPDNTVKTLWVYA